MDTLFSARKRMFRQETDWAEVPPSGFGRLLVAVAVIGLAIGLLDHAAAQASLAGSSLIASSYDPAQQRR
ncbi:MULTISPECIES: hypothetical protein [unclassified Mesorhizobium]|uniref:hypothetical protein n=1 Tax=unclassified Mesorhizobium TaxID=325217 RepID=UPI000F761DCD|nr:MULTISPECIES: hypothetical protein [unclassified Mesorhizobium]AZO20990.1 hypothetical protein EJ070_10090 [Mesorhizobium sp. M1E.F.Ca.ET.045.02.1.1]RUW35351.1 hypothetical protein EOA38_08430 [Mesorhizobium sp. M1E.F.Ca.ET.041.01.1.1]RUW85111.1 hypothetical protein EOA29_06445 [Mesorhizobium sp. M1E.F.Ca.ET.063.01.1.1]RWD86483.1 MAG: hypothetical protein EOS38_21090 [Mesorhizobium sp.]RWD87841.1 MAG: hypothetical protein EOS39_24380 [Mesorhizobium sp.]